MIGDVLRLPIAREAEVFVLGQYAFEFRFVFLDRFHRLLERLRDVPFFGKIQQMTLACVVGEIKSALLGSNVGNLLLAPRALELLKLGDDFGFVLAVIVVGELEED